MNYRASIVLGALLAVGITGCDPYDDETGGAPAVLGVTFAEGTHSHPIAGTDSGAGAWTVAGDENQQNVLFITTNKLLDPATIQVQVRSESQSRRLRIFPDPSRAAATKARISIGSSRYHPVARRMPMMRQITFVG